MNLARLYRQQRELRELRQLEAKYERLAAVHYATAAELERERQRASDAFFAATEPCESCGRYQDERDAALLELDEVRAALHWLEKDMKVT